MYIELFEDLDENSDDIHDQAGKLYYTEMSGINDDAPFIVALEDETLIGAVWMDAYNHHSLGRIIEFDIVIDPKKQKQGIGKKLANEFFKEVKDYNAKIVAKPISAGGKALIRSLGFEESDNDPEFWVKASFDETVLIAALYRITADDNIIVYHGSDNPNIKEFKKGIKSNRFLLFKKFEVESQGIFFTFDPEIAKEFGNHVYEVTISNPNLFLGIDEKYLGVQRLDPKREKELAQMLLSIANDGEINLYEKDIFVPDDFDINLKENGSQPGDNWGWIYEAVGDGLVWDVLDEPSFVNTMEKLGYHGTITEESSDLGGKSLFISDLSYIKNIEPYLDEDDDS